METKNYNADIAHCSGQNCPLREECKRYRLYCMIATSPVLHYASFISPEYNSGTKECEMFLKEIR